MQFQAEIANVNTLKKGMKITLVLDEKNSEKTLKHLWSFNGKPLSVTLDIDGATQLQRMNLISPEQRKKIYAILKDVGSWMGDTAESAKMQLKIQFTQETEYEDFSLSNCSKETATSFIEYLINWCFQMGVVLNEHPKDLVEDIEQYLRICLQNRVCAVCGKEAEVHHVDAIGMGRDRTSYDDSKHEKIALCRVHHTEAHNIGWQTFANKYHVKGIVL